MSENQHEEINERFYKLVEESFPHYELNFEVNGEVYLLPNKPHDYIVYYKGKHYVEANGWNIKKDTIFEVQILNTALNIIKEEVQNGK